MHCTEVAAAARALARVMKSRGSPPFLLEAGSAILSVLDREPEHASTAAILREALDEYRAFEEDRARAMGRRER